MVPYLPEPIHSMLAQRPHIMPSGPGVHTVFSYAGVLMSRTGGCLSGGPICFGGRGLLGPTSDMKPCSDTGSLLFCKLVSRRHPERLFRIFTQGVPCGSRGLEFATCASMELNPAQELLYELRKAPTGFGDAARLLQMRLPDARHRPATRNRLWRSLGWHQTAQARAIRRTESPNRLEEKLQRGLSAMMI